MAISKSFREAADIYSDTLDSETVSSMESKGYIFLSHCSINDGPQIPTEDWETLVEKLGGEGAINADFDDEQDPVFTATHIATGNTTKENGAVSVLARLWLTLN